MLSSLPASAGTLTIDLDRAFSSDQPDGAGPWVRLTFDDTGVANVVRLTIDTLLTGAGEHHSSAHKGLYLNLNPSLSATGLSFVPQSGAVMQNVKLGENKYKADGVGGHFDILMQFSFKALSTGAGDVVYHISHAGGSLSALDFGYFSHQSNPVNTYFAASHVQGTAGPEGSGWIGGTTSEYTDEVIPLPSTGAMAALGLSAMASRRRRASAR
jgi:hypothetical protein